MTPETRAGFPLRSDVALDTLSIDTIRTVLLDAREGMQAARAALARTR